MSASDTIIPIIDLTASAEGSDVLFDLQTALAFGNQTAFDVSSTTTTVASSPGFYLIVGSGTISSDSSTISSVEIILNDGTTDKTVWKSAVRNATTTASVIFGSTNIREIIYLAPAHSLKVKSSGSTAFITGSVRQIADNTGTLVQPTGFNPQ